MAVSALNKCCMRQGHCMRDKCRAEAGVVFATKYTGQIIEMASRQIANRGELPRFVEARDLASLYLIAKIVRPDGIDIGMRVIRGTPLKCFAEQVLRQISRGAVRAACDATLPKLVGHFGV